MSKINLKTLAANAARAKQALTRQQEKLTKLTAQIIERVGTGGQTIQTSLGQVIVTSQTFDRLGDGYNILFDPDKFNALPAAMKVQLEKSGVVTMKRRTIAGQAPRVQFRLNS